MSFKDLLKRILPPPVHAFNREVARILDAVDQSRRETDALRELIAAQGNSLDQLRRQLDAERARRLQWESQARDEWRAQQQAALDKALEGQAKTLAALSQSLEQSAAGLQKQTDALAEAFAAGREQMATRQQADALNKQAEVLAKQGESLAKTVERARSQAADSARHASEAVWAQIFNNTISESLWLKDKTFSPGRWAVGYPYLYVMYRVLNETRPKRILELGLGQSTRMIAQYAAAFQAVACLDEDGRLLSEEILSRRVEQAHLSSWIDRPDSVDIFFGPPPSQRQLDELRARGLTPDVRPLAHEALVFFVHKDNPVRNLSREQLRRIYTGEITNWEDLGGRDERILPFQHKKNNENQYLLARFILRGETPLPALREELRSCDFLSVNVVSRYYKRNNALGFGLRWYLGQWFPDGDVRPLAVDGVPPTDATVRDGSYPLSLPLCMISCRPLDAESRAFRDWLLGPEGRDLIRRAGYLPWDDENGEQTENGGGNDDTMERKDTEDAR